MSYISFVNRERRVYKTMRDNAVMSLRTAKNMLVIGAPLSLIFWPNAMHHTGGMLSVVLATAGTIMCATGAYKYVMARDAIASAEQGMQFVEKLLGNIK